MRDFAELDAPIRTLPQAKAGDAAALKLLRTILTKGLEALAVECLVAAEQEGIRAELYDAMSDVDAAGFTNFLDMLVRTHIQHSERRLHEVQRAEAQLTSLGLPASMLAASQRVFERTTRRPGELPPAVTRSDVDAALKWLASTTDASSSAATTTSAADIAKRAASVLGPESSLVEDLDAAGFAEAAVQTLRALFGDPVVPLSVTARLALDLARVPLVAGARWLGREIEAPVPVDPRDRRFADPTWTDNPVFHGIRLTYLVTARRVRELVAAADVDPVAARKAALLTDVVLDALAPTNALLMTRPRSSAPPRAAGAAWSAAPASSSTTSSTTAAGPVRSTRADLSSATTWLPPRARSCSATT